MFNGEDITGLSDKEMQHYRGSDIGLVPQDPMSNLNPVWSIGTQVKESLRANNVVEGSEANKRVVELLQEAGLDDAERRAKQYPHEFSGGMRQRALIGIGLAARPKLLIADEPTSALDVTVQRRILDHLEGLTHELGTAVPVYYPRSGPGSRTRLAPWLLCTVVASWESGPESGHSARPARTLHAAPSQGSSLAGVRAYPICAGTRHRIL